jgi:hypothetical protein
LYNYFKHGFEALQCNKGKKLETKTFFFQKIIAVSIDISKCYHFKHGFEALQRQRRSWRLKKFSLKKIVIGIETNKIDHFKHGFDALQG